VDLRVPSRQVNVPQRNTAGIGCGKLRERHRGRDREKRYPSHGGHLSMDSLGGAGFSAQRPARTGRSQVRLTYRAPGCVARWVSGGGVRHTGWVAPLNLELAYLLFYGILLSYINKEEPP
jgi:hypothetical protein